MNQKKNILIFIDWFLPGFKAGGPIKSVSNIINSLHQDFNFHIVTSDRDINDTSSYENVQLNTWLKKENYSIIYLTPDNRDEWINIHLKETSYDNYYFNSLFSKYFTLKPLLILNKLANTNSKIIIAPRGMLGKGALSIKPFKKKVFLVASKILSYFQNVTWHATNQEEKNDILKKIGKESRINIASNISLNIIKEKPISKIQNELKLVFFSRISPKKNLLYALNLLKILEGISLDIYGSIEDVKYWEDCLKKIKEHNINAHYKGEINPKDVNSTLSDYHFFIFPTLHENYGHVIVEALAAGCGLIISEDTPWRNLEKKGIGWDINLTDKEKFIQVLKLCIAIEQDEYNEIRNNCYNFVEKEINTTKEIEDTKNLFS